MENLKLISVRIDPETIDKIEKLRKTHYYWKRNTIINAVLTAVFDTFSDKEIYDMCRYFRHTDNKPEGSFSLTGKK